MTTKTEYFVISVTAVPFLSYIYCRKPSRTFRTLPSHTDEFLFLKLSETDKEIVGLRNSFTFSEPFFLSHWGHKNSNEKWCLKWRRDSGSYKAFCVLGVLHDAWDTKYPSLQEKEAVLLLKEITPKYFQFFQSWLRCLKVGNF
jgi:hypothetical protein